jgi:myxalamid-type polyketide synthase MxaB
MSSQRVVRPKASRRGRDEIEREAMHEVVVGLGEQPWLADHRVGELTIVPAAAIAEMLRAVAESHLRLQPELRGLVLRSPIVLQQARPAHLRVAITNSDTRASLSWRSVDAPAASWLRCAAAHLAPCGVRTHRIDIEAVRRRCNRSIAVDALYQAFTVAGLRYGPAFRGLRELACGQGEAFGRVELPEQLDPRGYGLHPALLDAALHVVAGAAPAGEGDAFIPFEIGRFVVHEKGHRQALVHARLMKPQSNTPLVDITLIRPDGTVIAELASLAFCRAAALTRMAPEHRGRAADLPPSAETEPE